MDIQEVIQTLEDRMRDNPKSLVFARLADAYLQTGEVDKALQLCLEGVNHHPSYVTGAFVLGKAYLAKGDHDGAEASLKNALSHDRQYLPAHEFLGDLMARTGWENKAAIHYRDLLRIDPLAEDVRQKLQSVSYLDTEPVEVDQPREHVVETPVEAPAEPDSESWKEELEEIISDSTDDSSILGPQPVDEAEAAPPVPETPDSVASDEDIAFELPEDGPSTDEPSADEKETPAPVGEAYLFSDADTTEEASLGEEPLLSETETDTALDLEPETKAEPEPEPESSELSPAIEASPADETKNDEEIESLLFEEEFAASPDETPDAQKVDADEARAEEPEEASQPSSGIVEETPVGETATDRDETKDDQKIVSPTLGEIYAAQGQFGKAIRVYETLLDKNPEDADRYRAKIDELKKKLEA